MYIGLNVDAAINEALKTTALDHTARYNQTSGSKRSFTLHKLRSSPDFALPDITVTFFSAYLKTLFQVHYCILRNCSVRFEHDEPR